MSCEREVIEIDGKPARAKVRFRFTRDLSEDGRSRGSFPKGFESAGTGTLVSGDVRVF
ncbi:MAG: hypothetical protein QF752_14810 [Planctomycetota bacterium]|jgi:hypothetical protein|nr:hypothetical protein [Planctomycetota bacterium]